MVDCKQIFTCTYSIARRQPSVRLSFFSDLAFTISCDRQGWSSQKGSAVSYDQDSSCGAPLRRTTDLKMTISCPP